MNPHSLFSERGALRNLLEQRLRSLREEIEGYDKDYVLNVSENDLCQHFISKYSLQMPTLHEDGICVSEPKEVEVASRSPPFRSRGTRVVIAVPFEGDGALLQYEATTGSLVLPSGEIAGQEIRLVYDVTEYDPQELKQRYEQELKTIKKHIEWTKSDLDNFNKSIEPLVREVLTERKRRLLAGSGLVSALGIPIKRRDDLAKTYAIPTLRKRIKVVPPKRGSQSPRRNISKSERRVRALAQSAPYETLRKLETRLRYVIQTRLQSISKNWWDERIPNDVRKNAEERKTKDENPWPWLEPKELDLISYVDFTDYAKIIRRKDNWKQVFKPIFKDEEIICSKLRELEPIRNAIAHNRELTLKENERLRLLARDLMSCLGK